MLEDAYNSSNQIQAVIQRYERQLFAKSTNNKTIISTKQMAVNYFKTVLKISNSTDDEQDKHINLGNTYRKYNEIHLAIEEYKMALGIAEERKDKLSKTEACIALGNAYRDDNQIQMAIAYLEKALEIAKKREDKLNETKHAWHFCTRNCRFKMSRFFSQPCRIFWSLVTNLILEKFPKFIKIIPLTYTYLDCLL